MSVTAGTPEALAWLCERAGCVLTPSATSVQAVDGTGRIRGVLAFDCWTLTAAQAHMAVDTPIVWRHLLRPGFDYVFRQARRSVLLGVIPSSNTRSCAMARAAGLREVYRVKDGWAVGDDLVVHEMRRDECRWLEG